MHLKEVGLALVFGLLVAVIQGCLTVDWVTRRMDEVWARMDDLDGRVEAWHRAIFERAER